MVGSFLSFHNQLLPFCTLHRLSDAGYICLFQPLLLQSCNSLIILCAHCVALYEKAPVAWVFFHKPPPLHHTIVAEALLSLFILFLRFIVKRQEAIIDFDPSPISIPDTFNVR